MENRQKICSICHGYGKVDDKQYMKPNDPYVHYTKKSCGYCKGTGWVDNPNYKPEKKTDFKPKYQVPKVSKKEKFYRPPVVKKTKPTKKPNQGGSSFSSAIWKFLFSSKKTEKPVTKNSKKIKNYTALAVFFIVMVFTDPNPGSKEINWFSLGVAGVAAFIAHKYAEEIVIIVVIGVIFYFIMYQN